MATQSIENRSSGKRIFGKSSLRSAIASIYRNKGVQAIIHASVALSGRDRRRMRQYFRDHSVLKLQIGSGLNERSDWLNTNWYPIKPIGQKSVFLDACRRFPFEDNKFDYISSEHMIEHVSYLGGFNMLQECFRVLRPGGRIRIATPDFDFLIKLLAPELSELERAYIAWSAKLFLPPHQPHTALAVVNNFVRDWGHKFIYDRATLEDALRRVGFVDIKSFAINESDDSVLRGIENPARLPEGFLQLESMTYEAVKPL